jgi:hypothetical protein
MNISLPGFDWLMMETINKLNRRCEEVGNEITALHNTLCLVMARLEGLERRFFREQVRCVVEDTRKEEPDANSGDDDGWTVVERRRGRT